MIIVKVVTGKLPVNTGPDGHCHRQRLFHDCTVRLPFESVILPSESMVGTMNIPA